jgi:queuine tRNA-ribosyltransferase
LLGHTQYIHIYSALVTSGFARLPEEKPNHLLGIADEPSIWKGAGLGVDTFDSCFPTRIARHGTILTPQGHLYIRKGELVSRSR